MVHQKMYVTGGIGATHIGEAFSFNYDLPNDTAYAETCASIGLVFFARRMLEIQAKAEYADVMELALYNGVLSGMALDGKSFFYVNPLEVLPEACHKDERKFHVKPIRQKWSAVPAASEPGKNGKLSCILRIHGKRHNPVCPLVHGWNSGRRKSKSIHHFRIPVGRPCFRDLRERYQRAVHLCIPHPGMVCFL